MSNNGLYVVAAGNTQVHSWARPDTSSAWVAKAGIPSRLNNIAFGRSTGDLIVIGDDGTVQEGSINEYSLCAFKTFYDSSNDACQDCNAACQSCYTGPDQCYNCNAKFYLEGTQCKACMPGCDNCTNAATCTACDAPNNWILVNDVCECAQKFFQDNDQCAACIVGCLTCNNQNTCETCDAAGNF